MITRTLLVRLAGAMVMLLLLTACAPSTNRILEDQQLFELSIGRSEHRLDMFQLSNRLMRASSHIHMRDGIFFISNGPANKVLTLTSYGDPINLIYNPRDNPPPTVMSQSLESDVVANQHVRQYPFRQVANIAVASNNLLWVEDRLEPEQAVFDDELGVGLDRVVLRFDTSEETTEYLGQEGFGGTPFPAIEKLFVNSADDVVVISRTPDRRLVYWFDYQGRLRFTVEIEDSRLPVPVEGELVPVLEQIVPDVQLDRLYLTIKYFQQNRDPQTGNSYGISIAETRVYWLNLDSGLYEGHFQVPRNVQSIARQEGYSDQQDYEFFYNCIGAISMERLYFLSQGPDGDMQILVMNTDGKVLQKRWLKLHNDGLIYSDFHVSYDGILSALLGYHDRAVVRWWRVDRLAGIGSRS